MRNLLDDMPRVFLDEDGDPITPIEPQAELVTPAGFYLPGTISEYLEMRGKLQAEVAANKAKYEMAKQMLQTQEQKKIDTSINDWNSPYPGTENPKNTPEIGQYQDFTSLAQIATISPEVEELGKQLAEEAGKKMKAMLESEASSVDVQTGPDSVIFTKLDAQGNPIGSSYTYSMKDSNVSELLADFMKTEKAPVYLEGGTLLRCADCANIWKRKESGYHLSRCTRLGCKSRNYAPLGSQSGWYDEHGNYWTNQGTVAAEGEPSVLNINEVPWDEYDPLPVPTPPTPLPFDWEAQKAHDLKELQAAQQKAKTLLVQATCPHEKTIIHKFPEGTEGKYCPTCGWADVFGTGPAPMPQPKVPDKIWQQQADQQAMADFLSGVPKAHTDDDVLGAGWDKAMDGAGGWTKAAKAGDTAGEYDYEPSYTPPYQPPPGETALGTKVSAKGAGWAMDPAFDPLPQK